MCVWFVFYIWLLWIIMKYVFRIDSSMILFFVIFFTYLLKEFQKVIVVMNDSMIHISLPFVLWWRKGSNSCSQLWSGLSLPGSKGSLKTKASGSFMTRRVYTHEEYIGLVMESGQVSKVVFFVVIVLLWFLHLICFYYFFPFASDLLHFEW